jgi:serine/threonine-protein kinase
MGVVHRGHDQHLGRDLAFKVLLPEHAGRAELVRRFIEEARVGGQLQHPGIAPVYDRGTLADQRPFFTMKLVEGRTMRDLLSDRIEPTADLSRFLAIFEAVCQTMSYAHAHGVIHRDLKPSNIMVGGFGEVQVMDWGLAKVLERAARRPVGGPCQEATHTIRAGPDAAASRAGSVLGTPAYMSPEQARGQTDRIDERTDVFALGAILCEILSGEPPYRAPSDREVRAMAARADLVDAIARLDVCGADTELRQLARSCLSAEPEDRPRQAGEVAGAVTVYLVSVQERLRRAELAAVEARTRTEEESKRRVLADQLASAAQARADTERSRRRMAVGLISALVGCLSSSSSPGCGSSRNGARRPFDSPRRSRRRRCSRERPSMHPKTRRVWLQRRKRSRSSRPLRATHETARPASGSRVWSRWSIRSSAIAP